MQSQLCQAKPQKQIWGTTCLYTLTLHLLSRVIINSNAFYFQKCTVYRTSLVAQWLRIHLPMQGTQVRALVREDPTCRRAAKPVRHNY